MAPRRPRVMAFDPICNLNVTMVVLRSEPNFDIALCPVCRGERDLVRIDKLMAEEPQDDIFSRI